VDRVELASKRSKECQRVTLNESTGAAVTERLDVDAGHVPAGADVAFGCASLAAEQVQQLRPAHEATTISGAQQ
jgi:hypothetical protein